MIAAVQGNGSLSSLYPQYNSKKIRPIKALQSNERTAEDWSQTPKKVSNSENSILTKYQSELAERTKNKEYMSYESHNPYEKARQTMDESLLVGMNFDVMA